MKIKQNKILFSRMRLTVLPLAFLLLFLLILSVFNVNSINAQTSPDAIAIRVIPNPNHYSPLRWYKDQKFTGSPQSLTVDGYEAVRDGRTVYVNAANIHNNTLYTNIYLISYNQEAESATVDIFGQILAHWRFNTNIETIGNCSITTATQCLIDNDCPVKEYCTSAEANTKANVIRDTRRLSAIADINTALEDYKKIHGRYPVLSAGTYLPNRTVSTWPSWQDALAKELGITLPLDPINTLGNCGGNNYDPITCWDEKTKKFADSNPANPGLDLPENSGAFIFSVSADGLGYEMCSLMESGYVQGSSNGACAGSASPAPVVGTVGASQNHPPQFTGFNLPTGYSGYEYAGYISAFDSDGDNLTWSIDTSGTDWLLWSAPPEMKSASVNTQRKIYATVAGEEGSYNFKVTISDGRGEPKTQTFSILVDNNAPLITAGDITYTASTTKPLELTITAVSEDPTTYPLSYNLTYSNAPGGEKAVADIASIVPGLSSTFIKGANNVYTYKVTGSPAKPAIAPANNFNFLETVYRIIIKVKDSFGSFRTAIFNIKIKNNPPNLSHNCPASIGQGLNYNCLISASDPDGNAINIYELISGPVGIGVDNNGNISGSSSEIGQHTVEVKVTDEYGANSKINFPLKIVTYCGDSSVQTPNTAGTKGLTNVGDEQCDFGVDLNCCASCAWTCTESSYALANLKFTNGADVFNDVTLNSGESSTLVFPACRIFDNASGLVDAELVGVSIGTAVVFVTDRSGSMPADADMGGVKSSLKTTIDNLNLAVNQDNAIISVGLVSFGTSGNLTKYPMNGASLDFYDVGINLEKDDLKNHIDTYRNDLGVTHTSGAMQAAYDALSLRNEPNKIIVLLSDGQPTIGFDPTPVITTAKNANIKIYTIAFTNINALKQTMCGWSSGVPCLVANGYINSYAYTGVDAANVYSQITADITSLPSGNVDIVLNGKPGQFNAGNIVTDIPLDFSGVNCANGNQSMNFGVNFGGGGQVKFFNARVNYCPACAP